MTKARFWSRLGIFGLTALAQVAVLHAALPEMEEQVRETAPKTESDAELVRRWRAAGFAFRKSELPKRPAPRIDGDSILDEFSKAARAGRPVLDLARRLADSDGIGYRPGKAPSAGVQFPMLATMRSAAKELKKSAIDLAKAGRRTESLADLRRLRRLGELTSEVGGTIPFLVRRAIESIGLDAAGSIALAANSDTAFRRAVRDALGSPFRNDYRAELTVEATEFFDLLRISGARADGFPADRQSAAAMRTMMSRWLALSARSDGLRDGPALMKAIAQESSRLGVDRRGMDHFLPIVADSSPPARTRRILLDAVVEGGRPEKKDAWGRPIRWRGPIPYSLGKDGKDNQGGKGDLPLIKIPS